MLRAAFPALADEGAEQKLAQAVALARAHRFAEADEELKGVSAPSDPKQAIAFHRLRASIQAALQRPEQASAEMHAALRLAPADTSLVRATGVADLGWLDAQLNASSHAGLTATLEDLRALSLPDRERAQLRSQMGERLLIAREYRSATVDLSEAVRLDPSRSEAWAQLADAQLHSGDPKEALGSALHARALHDTGELEALLGDIYEAAGDSIASAKSFEEAIRLSPGEERFALALAVELMRHQTFQPALTVLERSEIDFPQSPRTRTALGLALFLSGKEPEGTAKLREALSIDPAFIPAVRYLGELALGRPGTPDPQVIEAECKYANAHPSDNESNAICGGLEARAKSEDSPPAEWRPILRRLAALLLLLVIALLLTANTAKCWTRRITGRTRAENSKPARVWTQTQWKRTTASPVSIADSALNNLPKRRQACALRPSNARRLQTTPARIR